MNLPFVQRLMSGSPETVEKALPAIQTPAIQPRITAGKKSFNPFLSAMNTDSDEYREIYGINRPLAKPMFLGYRDNEAMYGGSKLFILY